MLIFILSGTASAYDNNGTYLTCYNCTDCTNALNNNTHSMVLLGANIINQSGNCIDSPANFGNKTFDCQGHTIDGNGTGNGIFTNSPNNGTIKSCIITGFNKGISIQNGDFWVLVNNSVNNNAADGIRLSASKYCVLTNNTANNNQYGFSTTSTSTNNTLTLNTFCSNTQDINNNATNNAGDNNTCNTTSNWNDTGTTGCTYSCGSGNGTNGTSLNLQNLTTQCHAGNNNLVICSTINASIHNPPSPSIPPELRIECRYDTPTQKCYAHVERNMSDVIVMLLGNPLIDNVTFIQNGTETTNVVVYSEPYQNYAVRVTINGTMFSGSSPELTMHVTGISNLLTPEFNVSDIDPSEFNELGEIASMMNESNISVGPGFGPDFSLLKSIQNFTWNMTLPFNSSAHLVGVAACNGTLANNSCVNSSIGNGTWYGLSGCPTCGNCTGNSYALDCPDSGRMTVYGADPVPVYAAGEANETTITCNSCSDCTAKLNGNYSTIYMNLSISDHNGTCINNPANFTNKTFDCQGHTIDGIGSGYGIYKIGSSNITIRNCNIMHYWTGVYLQDSSNTNLYNNKITRNHDGILISNSSGTILSNNLVCGNRKAGTLNHRDIRTQNSTDTTGYNNTCRTTNDFNDTNATGCANQCPRTACVSKKADPHHIEECGENITGYGFGDVFNYTIMVGMHLSDEQYEDLECGFDNDSMPKFVDVTDVLPEGIRFVSADPAPTMVSGRIVSWRGLNATRIKNGIKLTARVEPDARGNLTNLAKTTFTYNNTLYHGRAHEEICTPIPYIYLKKKPQWQRHLLTGVNYANFTIVGNTNEKNFTNVTVIDIMPSDATFVSASPNVTAQNGSHLIWELGNMSAGNITTINITLSFPIAVKTYRNTVIATAYLNNSLRKAKDHAWAMFSDRMDPVWVYKDPDETTNSPGDYVSFEINTVNEANTSTRFVETIDTLPSGLEYVYGSVICSGIGYNESAVEWVTTYCNDTPSVEYLPNGSTVLTWYEPVNVSQIGIWNYSWTYNITTRVSENASCGSILMQGVYTYANVTTMTENYSANSTVYVYGCDNAAKNISLNSGWNLISSSLLTTAETFLNQTGCDLVSRYAGGIQTYIKGASNFNFNVTPGHGYYTYCQNPGNKTITGTPVSGVNISLTTGWNLIGSVPEAINNASALRQT